MISNFFIDRPIFASVLSIVLVLAGVVAWRTLPVEQYPNVTPPTVQVTALYPGANAATVRDTVAAPIEAQVSGVEGMMYMSSQSTNDGAYNLTVTFKQGFNSDMAQVLVQNRVSLALPVIPQLVQTEGINVQKVSPSTLMIVNLISPDNRYDSTFLSNYATIYIKDELGRLDGIAAITLLGQRDYSLRVWLDPDKLAALNLSAVDVVSAISQQNLQVAAGQIGQPPAMKAQQFQLTINTLGRLTDPEEFANIIVKAAAGRSGATPGGASPSGGGAGAGGTTGPAITTNPTGPTPPATSVIRLKDVVTVDPKTKQPRVELGSQQYNQSCTLDGQQSVALSIFTLPGSNALKTADGVYAKLAELKTRFPEGVDYRIGYNTTPFISESIADVYRTLRDAIILVAIVVLVFLQNWRATLIPLIAVPVALIGTFGVMAALGYSLNNLSLFGLVLAIGIVVDDAIVVVENVERWLEQGVEPREAARKAMAEVTGPIIAVALVLCAVFVPSTFLGGISGQFFRQFAVTIAVCTVISAFNSLTLSPALAALLLKPRGARPDPPTRLLNFGLGWFFHGFNWLFGAGTALYSRVVGGLLRISLVVLLIYAGLLGLTYVEFTRAPTGFIPDQDAGYLMLTVQLPDAASVAAHGTGHGSHRQTGPRHARGRAHGRGLRAVVDPERQRAQPRLDVRHSQGLRGAARPEPECRRDRGGTHRTLSARGARGDRDGVRCPADRGPGDDRRLQTHHRGPRQPRPGRTAARQRSDRGSRQQDGRAAGAVQQRAGRHALAVPGHRPHQVHWPWAWRSATSSTRSRSTWARTTSTTSTSSAEPGRSTSRPTGASANGCPTSCSSRCATARGDMVRLGTLMTVRDSSGPVVLMRYNMYAATAITGNPAPGTSSGQAISLDAGGGRPASCRTRWRRSGPS